MLAGRYDTFLLDLDGVLYRGPNPVPGAAQTLAELRSMGKRLAFVTNNSARTPQAVAERLRSVGVQAAADEVVTSAAVTAGLLVERGLRSAFVIGEEGLIDALTERGIEIVPAGAPRAEAVVVGWDRTVDYEKLRIASVMLQEGAAFVASNPDASFPAPDGRAWPGAGALIAAIQTTTGLEPEIVGKPRPPIFHAALARAGGSAPLVIGDRLDTDIAGAIGVGWDSMLVLTGISAREDVVRSGIVPTFIADDLTALLRPA
jgi:HAD superfamily hydrolase (TIGR01457 family)